MVYRVLTFIALILMAHALPARAQTACSMIDTVLDTASILQESQTAQSDREYQQYIDKLERRAAHISLPALIPPKLAESFPREKLVLSHYLYSLQNAIELQRGGYNQQAQHTLKQARTVEFSQSLKSLGFYWNCHSGGDEQGIEMRGQDSDAFYSAASDTGAISPKSDFAKAITHNAAASSGRSSSPLYGRKAALAGVLSYQSSLFMIIVSLLIGGGIYYFRRRAKAFKMREERRYLYQPVSISIGQRNHIITLVDISMNGAKLKHDGILSKQKTLYIELGEALHAGDIMWSNDFFSGVKFKKPIPQVTFNKLAKSASKASKNDQYI